MNQRTISREVSTHGKALHTGQMVHLTFKPAEPGQGYVFRRVDLPGQPELRPHIEQVASQLVRSTDISSGHTRVHTIEHVLSALAGMGIDNCIIELDASEPPILDGSAKHYVNLLQKAEPVEQQAQRAYYVLDEPISVTDGNRSIIALPCDGLKITCTSADDRGIHTQHLSLDISPDSYIAEIAPARTFTIYEDIEPLLKMGKIQGGSLDSAIVIKGNQMLSREPLRFNDEFVRHKILDIVGDITLLGRPLKAHIVAVRPGHKLNADLTRHLWEKMRARPQPKALEPARKESPARRRKLDAAETIIGIRRILDVLPHAYPFVMVDRVIEFRGDTELTAIKNVTINEPYFVGHYPGNPVMPGVLQIEAMAQAAGLLMLRRVSADGRIALFMSADKVKFRRAVVPGDQLRIDVKILRNRNDRLAVAECRCTVEGQLAACGELMFTLLEIPEEGF
jgi:UDP-3-O-[3-hydroxymyristoyl] N-acetylglucosamine deacetylase/3-hydroxyacyl-[acyl-carrier-protein] dehydratase